MPPRRAFQVTMLSDATEDTTTGGGVAGAGTGQHHDKSSWKVMDKGINLRDFQLTDEGVFLSGKKIDLELISPGDIDVDGSDIIGKGASGFVYKVKHRPTGKPLALKMIRVEERAHRDEIEKELIVLQKGMSACPYLVRNYGAYYDPAKSTINLPLEWMDGTLSTAIKLVDFIWEDILKLVAFQVISAIAYLHKIHVVHRDIKPGNILMNGDGYVKVSDFGISKVFSSHLADQKSSTFVGTQTYMSPERLTSDAHGYSSDIWAFGLTMIQCATGKNPWHTVIDESEAVTVFTIKRCTEDGKLPALPEKSGENVWSAEARDFVRRCVMVNPDDRATAQELVSHPFLSGVTETSATSGMKAFVLHLARIASAHQREFSKAKAAAAESAMSDLDGILDC